MVGMFRIMARIEYKPSLAGGKWAGDQQMKGVKGGQAGSVLDH